MHAQAGYLGGQMGPRGVESLEGGHVPAGDRPHDGVERDRPARRRSGTEGDHTGARAAGPDRVPHGGGRSHQVMRLEEQDAVDIDGQRRRRRIADEHVDVLPFMVLDPPECHRSHVLAQLDTGDVPGGPDDRPEIAEAGPGATPHVEDVISGGQPQAFDRTASQRGDDPGMAVVPRSEPTVAASSLGDVR